MTALTETADRQSLWSSSADALKRRIEVARWITFVFSIFGALLAAIASQLNHPQPRLYFAIAGAVLLAVVSFVTSRLLTGTQITNWVRARTASEALKREAYKYAASAAPYDDPLKRDAALNGERERIEKDVDDLLASAVAHAGGPVVAGTICCAARAQSNRRFLPAESRCEYEDSRESSVDRIRSSPRCGHHHRNGWYRWKGDLWHQIRFRCSHGRAHYDCSRGACAH